MVGLISHDTPYSFSNALEKLYGKRHSPYPDIDALFTTTGSTSRGNLDVAVWQARFNTVADIHVFETGGRLNAEDPEGEIGRKAESLSISVVNGEIDFSKKTGKMYRYFRPSNLADDPTYETWTSVVNKAKQRGILYQAETLSQGEINGHSENSESRFMHYFVADTGTIYDVLALDRALIDPDAAIVAAVLVGDDRHSREQFLVHAEEVLKGGFHPVVDLDELRDHIRRIGQQPF